MFQLSIDRNLSSLILYAYELKFCDLQSLYFDLPMILRNFPDRLQRLDVMDNVEPVFVLLLFQHLALVKPLPKQPHLDARSKYKH